MARGRGRDRSGSTKPRKSGIEQYGEDDADAFLKLYDDDAPQAQPRRKFRNEEEVFALKTWQGEEEDLEDAEDAPKKKGKKSEKPSKGSVDEEDLGPISKGWRSSDFYGGDEAGYGSDAASDEELMLQEAKKLEELRALRLRGLATDPLAALLGPSTADSEKPGLEDTTLATASDATTFDASAQFESVFAAEAEKTSVRRDLSQLSSSKRKSLLRKESPELMPLLEDFKAKLQSLRELLPLLEQKVSPRLPASGASYLQAKVSLMLNHLANLSFYLLLKAEGGDVRAHPVVSQLVWLKELQENLSPIDKQLSSQLKKALQAAKEIPEPKEDIPEVPASVDEPEEKDEPKPRRTLAERLERLRLKTGERTDGKHSKAASQKLPNIFSKPSRECKASDLLRLPARRRQVQGGSGEAPRDLDEFDPTLGAWLPSSNVSQQVSEVQQFLRERRAKSEVGSADVNPEPRARTARTKVQEEVDPRANGMKDDDDGGRIIREAKEQMKEKKSAKQVAKEQAKLARQYKPEKVVDGRRASSKRILENRGLVRFRKKKAGNARVANRSKYEKLLKKRRGAVQEMRQGSADGATYEGEATGIRTNLKKSLKLG